MMQIYHNLPFACLVNILGIDKESNFSRGNSK